MAHGKQASCRLPPDTAMQESIGLLGEACQNQMSLPPTSVPSRYQESSAWYESIIIIQIDNWMYVPRVDIKNWVSGTQNMIVHYAIIILRTAVASPRGNGWVRNPPPTFCSDPSWDLHKSVESVLYMGGSMHVIYCNFLLLIGKEKNYQRDVITLICLFQRSALIWDRPWSQFDPELKDRPRSQIGTDLRSALISDRHWSPDQTRSSEQ